MASACAKEVENFKMACRKMFIVLISSLYASHQMNFKCSTFQVLLFCVLAYHANKGKQIERPRLLKKGRDSEVQKAHHVLPSYPIFQVYILPQKSLENTLDLHKFVVNQIKRNKIKQEIIKYNKSSINIDNKIK